MTLHPALQDTSCRGVASRKCLELAETILTGEIGITDAIGSAARLLLAGPRVDVVVSTLTSFTPDDTQGWTPLGSRAWIREWRGPDATFSMLPQVGPSADDALTMPWLSQLGRAGGTVALMDRDLMPSEAARDKEELERAGIRSLIGTTYLYQGEMFGSLSIVSDDAGAWPQQLVDDLRLLNVAITSRLTLGRSRRALAEAIEASTEAHLAHHQLFGAVGHELRTPVSAVLGYSEGLLDDAQHGASELVVSGTLRDGPRIIRACEELLEIVDSLLGAGRTLSGDDALEDVSVADALADVVHWHNTPALTAGVRVVVDDLDPGLTVWGHGAGVRQVLTNLLGNAITHHRPEGGTVHLSAERLVGESAQRMVRIIVRDDGPGLEPDQLARAFEPFVRFAPKDIRGTGLGLAISRTIAERDGGAVRGESVPGVGSTFWLELPAQALASVQAAAD